MVSSTWAKLSVFLIAASTLALAAVWGFAISDAVRAEEPAAEAPAAEELAIAESMTAEATLGELEIHGYWLRATPPTAAAGAGYMTVENLGAEDDRLIAARVDFAARTELHRMDMVDGVMRMREVEDGLPTPAGGVLSLEPGGLHLMMMGLEEQLVEGEAREVTLVFEKAGEVTILFPVLSAAPMDHGAHDHGAQGQKDHGSHAH